MLNCGAKVIVIFEISPIFAQKNYKKNKMKRVLGIGNALVDVLVQVENELILSELDLPKGSMQLIDTERYLEIQRRFSDMHQQRTTGGSACNTILAIANLGGNPGLIGKVGRDEPACFFSDNCRAHDINACLLVDTLLPTGVASTIITPDGQRTFGTYLGAAAALEPDDILPEWFDGYDYFYIEGYLVQNHALVRRAVDLAREAGLQVCIDLASYNIVQEDRAFFAELLPKTDIVFANELEAAAFTGMSDAQQNIEILSSLCSIAVVKVGKEGVWVRQGASQWHCPAREVPRVVDTTAAGDYFSAGFLYGLADGRSLCACAELGSLLSGHIIEVVGTALSESTWQKIKALI